MKRSKDQEKMLIHSIQDIRPGNSIAVPPKKTDQYCHDLKSGYRVNTQTKEKQVVRCYRG